MISTKIPNSSTPTTINQDSSSKPPTTSIYELIKSPNYPNLWTGWFPQLPNIKTLFQAPLLQITPSINMETRDLSRSPSHPKLDDFRFSLFFSHFFLSLLLTPPSLSSITLKMVNLEPYERRLRMKQIRRGGICYIYICVVLFEKGLFSHFTKMYESGEAALRMSPQGCVALGVTIQSIKEEKKEEWGVVYGLWVTCCFSPVACFLSKSFLTRSFSTSHFKPKP